MKKLTMKNVIISVLLVTVVCLATYIFEIKSQAKELNQEIQELRTEKVVFERTSQFDKQLEELLNYKENVASSFEEKYIWIASDEKYDELGYNIVSYDGQISFGYKIVKDGLEILIGNWSGSEYKVAHVWDLKNPEIITTELQTDEWVIEWTTQSMIKFEWYGITYLMDENLKVWKETQRG